MTMMMLGLHSVVDVEISVMGFWSCSKITPPSPDISAFILMTREDDESAAAIDPLLELKCGLNGLKGRKWSGKFETGSRMPLPAPCFESNQYEVITATYLP